MIISYKVIKFSIIIKSDKTSNKIFHLFKSDKLLDLITGSPLIIKSIKTGKEENFLARSVHSTLYNNKILFPYH